MINPFFIPFEISLLVSNKANNSNLTHSISSLILFTFPHNNVDQTNQNKIPIFLIIPSLIHLCSPSNQIKTSIPRTFSAIFAKALFIYLFIFCALESLSVIESLLCFWTLEGTVLAYASAFDLKSQKLTNLSFSFSWNLHFDPILFESILLELYKLHVVLHTCILISF